MIPPWHILAARGDGDLGIPDWLIALAAIVIGLIAAVIERVGKRRRGRASEAEGTKRPPYKPLESRPAPAAPARPPPFPMSRPISGQPPAAAGSPMEPVALRPRPKPVRRPTPVLLEPVDEESVRVGEELRQEDQRRGRQEEERQRRMAKPQSAVEQTALGSRLPPGPAGLEPAPGAAMGLREPAATAHPSRPRLRLDRQRARLAIIYHEIFSLPKALRQGPETWDL